MRSCRWGTVLALLLTLTGAARGPAAVPPFVRVTYDGKSIMPEKGMVAPVTGKIAFLRRVTKETQELVVAEADGRNAVTVSAAGLPSSPVWSPDGSALSYCWSSAGGEEQSVRVWREADRATKSLTAASAEHTEFVWSPNSKYLTALRKLEDKGKAFFVIFEVASGRETILAPNHYQAFHFCSWAPDSSRLCFASKETTSDDRGLWICEPTGANLRRLTPKGCKVGSVVWEPGGEWIVFGANYKRLESWEEFRDLWMIRPSGEGLRRITDGSGRDWQHQSTSDPGEVTRDGRYAISCHWTPDPGRKRLSWGMSYTNLETGEITQATGDDVNSRCRMVNCPYMDASWDGSRFLSFRQESEIHNLGTRDEEPGRTWAVGEVFELRTRTRTEVFRFEPAVERVQPSGGPSFSPDGNRVYFTLEKIVSESGGITEPDVVYLDLREALGIEELPEAPISPTGPMVEPQPAGSVPSAGQAVDVSSGVIRLPVQNIRADEAVSLLPDRDQPFVKADVRRNSLLVNAPPEMLAAIQRDLCAVDVAAPQIAVDVIVMELSCQAARDLGLDLTYSKGRWAALTPVGQSSRLGPANDDGLPLLPGNTSGLGEIIYQGVGELPETFFAHLQALESKGEARVQATPTVVATSGREATITVRQRANFFYTTGYDIYGRPTLAKSDISADINMKILPVLLGNGKVLLDVDALVGSFTFKSAGALPDTTDRQVVTSLTVANGQTVVIGGLKQQQTAVSKQRVPILGDLPLLGNLFRRTGQRTTESTLTVLITPRVCPEPEEKAQLLLANPHR